MALAWAEAQYDELHQDRPFHDGTEKVWSDKRSVRTPFGYRDGTSLWVAPMDLNPDDDFLAAPRPPALPGDSDEPSGDHTDADDQ